MTNFIMILMTKDENIEKKIDNWLYYIEVLHRKKKLKR